MKTILKRIRDESVTLMVVPGARQGVRSWRLRLLHLYVGVGALLIGCLLSLTAAWWAAGVRGSLVDFQRRIVQLEREREALQAELEWSEDRLLGMAEAAEGLSERIEALETLGAELSTIVGEAIVPVAGEEKATAESPSSPGEEPLGVGGGELTRAELVHWVEERLAGLAERVDGHGARFERLQETVDLYTHRLQHTPSIWPVEGRVTSHYGVRRHPISGRTHVHAGIDIGVPTGTPVAATADGVVVAAKMDGGYGLVVTIDHGYGLTTLYAHNSSLKVKAGDAVTRGQVIALSGNTGVSTGPHVHYEVRVNGEPVDPRAYLPSR